MVLVRAQGALTHLHTRAQTHLRIGAAAALRYIGQEGGMTSYVLNTSPEVLRTYDNQEVCKNIHAHRGE